MTLIEKTTREGCQIEVWYDHSTENPNQWSGEDVCLVAFDHRSCWLPAVGAGTMELGKKEDVRALLAWDKPVPPDPGEPPEEPDAEDYPDTDEGQAEYDAAYTKWQARDEAYDKAVEAREEYEDWEDSHREGYRVFTVGAHVHSQVHLTFGEEIFWSDEYAFDQAFGFVVVRVESFVEPEAPSEEFLRIAEERPRHGRSEEAAREHFEQMRRYVSGEVYGFSVEAPDGVETSLGGIYEDPSSDYVQEQIEAAVKAWVDRRDKFAQSMSSEDLAKAVHAVKHAEAGALIAEGDEAMTLYLLRKQQGA